MRQIISKNPLFFAWLLPALTDGIVTLTGQGKSYWINHNLANEASPAYYFLAASPWLFVLGSVVWFFWWYWLFLRLKPPLNFLLIFLFISGHSWGSTSWIFKLLKPIGVSNAWFLAVVYFGLIAALASYCLGIYFKRPKFEKFEPCSFNEIKRGLVLSGRYNQEFINAVINGLKQSSFYRKKQPKNS